MYAVVPPLAVTVAVPFEPPLQLTLVVVVLAVRAAGSVMVTVFVAVQLLASVAVTVYVPAVSPVAFALVDPLLHA